jgi:hypothetical protein
VTIQVRGLAMRSQLLFLSRWLQRPNRLLLRSIARRSRRRYQPRRRTCAIGCGEIILLIIRTGAIGPMTTSIPVRPKLGRVRLPQAAASQHVFETS